MLGKDRENVGGRRAETGMIGCQMTASSRGAMQQLEMCVDRQLRAGMMEQAICSTRLFYARHSLYGIQLCQSAHFSSQYGLRCGSVDNLSTDFRLRALLVKLHQSPTEANKHSLVGLSQQYSLSYCLSVGVATFSDLLSRGPSIVVQIDND